MISPLPRGDDAVDLHRMLDYCAALDAHNDRDWFHLHHKEYELARADFFDLLEQLRFAVADADPLLAPDLLYMRARDWAYRIPRDMRIHKNAPPYQPSFRAYFASDRRSWKPIGYFLRIAPGQSCFGTGLWCEDTPSTNRVRLYIQRNWEELLSRLAENGLELSGDKLKTMPRGFDPTHPAAEWVRHRNWSVLFSIPDAELTGSDALEERVREMVRRLMPLRVYLLAAAGDGGGEEERE